MKKLSVLLVVVMLAALFAACAAPAPQVVEKVVTQQVEKVVTQQVEVEKVVKETVQVEVTKVVEATPVPAEASGCNVAAPEKATQVDMLGWAFPITSFYAKELEKCNGVENIRVNTQLLDSGSAREQARLALSGKGTSPYEIVHVDDPLLSELASQGKLLGLNDLIAKYKDQYDLGDIGDSLYGLGTYTDTVYGIPIVANTMHYFYNTDVFTKHGLAAPETYDDVIASCAKLKEDKDLEVPFTINLHAGWAWRVEFHNMLKAYGGDWLNEDSTPKFNSPEGVKAVEKILEVVEACMGPDGLTLSIDDVEIGLETGTQASANTWASRAANMDNPEKSQLVGKIGFAPAPRGGGRPACRPGRGRLLRHPGEDRRGSRPDLPRDHGSCGPREPVGSGQAGPGDPFDHRQGRQGRSLSGSGSGDHRQRRQQLRPQPGRRAGPHRDREHLAQGGHRRDDAAASAGRCGRAVHR